jgi:hypothetical protein
MNASMPQAPKSTSFSHANRTQHKVLVVHPGPYVIAMDSASLVRRNLRASRPSTWMAALIPRTPLLLASQTVLTVSYTFLLAP